MQSHNASYLALGIEDWPSAIFAHGGATYRKAILERFASKKRSGDRFSEDDLDTLIWHPETLADLLAKGMISDNELHRLVVRSMPAMWRTLVCNYEVLSPMLESHLLSDAESVERLLHFFTAERVQPYNPLSIYEGLLDTDPNRLMRIARSPHVWEMVVNSCRAQAETRRLSSPGWAFFYLRTTRTSLIPKDLLEVLLSSEEYSYLSARLMRDRHVVSSQYAPLVNRLKSPRWVYHALRDALGGDQEQMFDLLLKHPAWLVQYLSRNATIEEISNAYDACVQKLSDGETVRQHPCISDLHLWFESVSVAAVISKVTAAA